MPNIHVKKSPLDLLLPYQRALADDDARFKFALQARQTGKDFASGAEGIRDCFLHEKKKDKVTWLIAAPSERQSMESLEKWKEWTEAFKLAIDDIQEEREGKSSESLLKSTTIMFPNGSRVVAVPGKPDTVRGFSANILLTEFAFFEDPDKTWRAILPSITNPLRGGLKKCRLVTTPNGVGNKAHQLWVENYQQPKSKWSCHRIDIYDAVKQGLTVDPEELREALNDPEGWAQEYELNFLDQATVLLPYELIVPCENPLAMAVQDAAFWSAASGGEPIVCGIDFGRTRDLTVCWSLAMDGSFGMTKEVVELRNMSTPDQVDVLRSRLRRARRVCLDYTGPGIGFGDLIKKEFGEYKPEEHKFGKVELCKFTNNLKLELFPALRVAFEQKRLGIPISRIIRDDLHSMCRVAMPSGGVTYKAPHTKDGHADRCTGLALAWRAAGYNSGPVAFSRVTNLNLPGHRQNIFGMGKLGKGVLI